MAVARRPEGRMPVNHRDDIAQIIDEIPDLYPRFDPRLFQVFLEELLTWNPQLGLISKRATPAVAARLIRLSVELWEFAAEYGAYNRRTGPWRVADIGSGAGFPGVLWTLLVPRLEIALIERKSRRAHYLERVTRRMGLSGVEVFEADLTELARLGGQDERFDLAVMMAVTTPTAIGGSIERILKSPGYLANVRAAGEKNIPAILGPRLQLKNRVRAARGVYLLYRKSPQRRFRRGATRR